jgi:molybdate transport system substrate-binding protein
MRLAARILACLLTLLHACPAFAADRPLTVFAAASLRESLDAATRAWEVEGHGKVVVSYAASSALARQIEQGAPADIFVSADNEWMDYLLDRKLIEPASRFTLVRNSLVLVAPANSKLKSLDPSRRSALLAALGRERLAIAETTSVPAGKYARQSLEKLGIWDAIADRLAQAENVRAALEYVARGDTPLGIVYFTDARAEPRVKIVGRFPDKSHDLIVYPAARTSAAADPKLAATFLEFLRSRRAVEIFRRAGFVENK